MKVYETLGHMKNLSEDLISLIHYYLPRHAVFKHESKTTKLRVVFDDSAETTSEVSLNDTLITGPIVQDDLIAILL